MRLALTILFLACAAPAAADCIPVDAVPATIEAPGAYCLTADLHHTGVEPAINIQSDDVDLDLAGFTLTGPFLPDEFTAGIFASFRSGVRVHGGNVEGFRMAVFLYGPAGVGPVVEDVNVLSTLYIGIFAEGPGATVRHCRVSNAGGSTLPDDTIAIGIFVYGHGAEITSNIVLNVMRGAGPTGEAVGIALGSAVPSLIYDNVVVNPELLPNSWAIWVAPPNDTLIASNFISRYYTGLAFPSDTDGMFTGNLFMNVTDPVLFKNDPVYAMDGGGNHAFRAACQPIYELPWVISEQGRYCLVRNLSTAQVAGSAIEIAASDVVLELGPFKVGGGSAGAGTQTAGVHAVDRHRVVVRGGNVRGFRRAVFLEETTPGASGGHLVEHVLADGNTVAGIDVTGGSSIVRRNQVVNVGGATTPEDAVAIRVEGNHARVIGNDVSAADPLNGALVVGIHVVNGTGAVVESNRVSVEPGVVSVGVLFENSGEALALRNRILGGDDGIVYDTSDGKYGQNAWVGTATPFTGGTDIGGNN